ncbi:high affinity immunoglobulin gamma Fc receptor I-like [Leptodactylus fuscus]
MTCDAGPNVQKDQKYDWFRTGTHVHSGQTYVITSAETSHSGSYQCFSQHASDSLRLDVSNSWVILQVPNYVYEGDDLALRCHHYPGYQGGQTIFYKDNKVIQNWSDDDSFHITRVDLGMSGTYKCTKQVKHNLIYYKHGGEDSILVRELFTTPTINVMPNPVSKADNMTLTCQTSLPPPPRHNTQLRIAFYREGGIVQGFGVSDTYEVYNVQLEDSGKYSCEVETTDGRVRKRSAERIIQIEGFGSPQISMMSIKSRGEDYNEGSGTQERAGSHTRRHNTQLRIAFYREGGIVQGFGVSDTYEVYNVQLEDSGKYSCEVETTDGRVRKRSAEQIIQIEGFFSQPKMIMTNSVVVEGDPMTLTCDTTLGPTIKPTEVQFAFYRDGQKVQGFTSSNKYEARSAQIEDSGNYTCEIKNVIDTVVRRSHGEGGIVQGFGVSDNYKIYSVQMEDCGKFSCQVSTSEGRAMKRSAEQVIQLDGDASHNEN